ncbi:helix-turn-helix domain-containing protein [Natrialbaceae archaeon AArc-T1-2]|uniref:helix-turn-helix domain-containing protein n=1 Tax=Natrialbaceae archaeon AArc-T1-2 TaxID=3053904 RepID=UPI00255B1CB6|nr:helix-turn-helix domain-containing protein [Natrialbaceae archaeon AArc-T1-2]WIV66667.1 helix-turn-helix domain-containing protein [Natrialbaceae archaeon AArc-T1-2]
MATVVELEISANRLVASHAFDRASTIEFELGGMIGDGPPLCWVSGTDRTTIETALEDDPTIEVVATLTDTSDGRWLYRLAFGKRLRLFEQLVSSNAGAILEATGRDGTWVFQLLFHDRAALSEAYTLVSQYEFRPSVTQLTPIDGLTAEGSPLTQTQYETIAAAYEHGYFDVPRQVTLKELATELGISHQALSERLRRSHAALANAALSKRLEPTKIDP